MKNIKLLTTLLISFFLVAGIYVSSHNEITDDFFVYNTIIDYKAKSNYAAVFNRESKKIKFEKNADKSAYPASLTKMMTAIVAIENIENLDKLVKVDTETYIKMVNQGSSMAGFYGNETVAIKIYFMELY